MNKWIGSGGRDGTEFFFHEGKPVEAVLGRSDTPGRFESDLDAPTQYHICSGSREEMQKREMATRRQSRVGKYLEAGLLVIVSDTANHDQRHWQL